MTQKLKEVITELLGQYCTTRYQRIHASTKYPYAVYDFDMFLDEDCHKYTLEVNLWNDDQDTTIIDTLADKMLHGLNKYHYSDNNIAFTMYLNTRNSVEDTDKKLSRIRLLFDLYAYRKD